MKILLLDTAFSALPIYNYLLEKNDSVWVMGNRPDDILARMAGDKWISQDYSKVFDVAAHCERLGIDFIVPGCTDVSFETYSQIKKNGNSKDSPEITKKLSNKQEFRVLCEQLSIPSPRLVELSAFPTTGRYICKPADAYSGHGITVFDGMNLSHAQNAYEDALKVSRGGKVLFETFEQGDLYSCSAFIENSKVIERFYVREGSSVNPYAVDTSYVDFSFCKKMAFVVEGSLEKLAENLSIKDGLIHAQFIVREGSPFLIEITRRCPGDLYSLLIEYSTGYSYAAKYASYFIGDQLISTNTLDSYVLRHTIATDKDTIYGGIRFLEPENVIAYYPLAHMGQTLRSRQKDRAGILFTKALNRDELIKNFDKFMIRNAYAV